MQNFNSDFQQQRTTEQFYSTHRQTDKENLDDNIQQYFNQFEEKKISAQSSKTKLFEQLQKNQEFIFDYDKKLLQVYNDIYKLEGNKPTVAMQRAQKKYQGTQKNFILPAHLLDPLIEGYDKKTEILTQELKSSKQELKKLTDNRQLRSNDKKRNMDFKNLLQILNTNEQKIVTNLQQQLQSLQQQLVHEQTNNNKLQEQNEYHRSYSNQGQKQVNEYLQKIQNLQDQISQQNWQLKNLQEYKFKTQPKLNELETEVNVLKKQQQREQMLIKQLQHEKTILKESYQKFKQKYEELEDEKEIEDKKYNKEIINQQEVIDQLTETNQQLLKKNRKNEKELYLIKHNIQKDKVYQIPNESIISQYEPTMQIPINQAESIVQNQVKKNLMEQFQNESNNFFDISGYEYQQN